MKRLATESAILFCFNLFSGNIQTPLNLLNKVIDK